MLDTLVSSQNKRQIWILAIGCFLFTLLLYLNTLNHGFVYDDEFVIVYNKDVKKGIAGIPEIFENSYFHGFMNVNVNSARPIPLSAFAIEYELVGLNPKFYHFNNILLNSIIALLLFTLLLRLMPHIHPVYLSLMTCLFISHPTHVEVVANIKSRDVLFCFFFILISWHSAIRIKGGSLFHWILCIVSFILALLSLETAVTFVLLIPLSLYFFISPKMKIPIILATILSITFILIWFGYIQNLGDMLPIRILNNSLASIDNYVVLFANAIHILGRYLILFSWPVNLGYNYAYQYIPILPWYHIYVFVSACLYCTLVFFALKGFSKRTPSSFWIIFYLAVMSVYSNIFFLAPDPMADRFLYIASLGLTGFLMTSGLSLFKVKAYALSKGKHVAFFYLFSLLLLVLFSFKTLDRNMAWKDNYTLYKTDIKLLDKNARAHFNWGTALMEKAPFLEDLAAESMLRNALLEYEQAIDIFPEFTDALNNAGVVSNALNQPDYAFNFYHRALKIDSTYYKAHKNIGNYYVNAGYLDKAKYHFSKCFSIMPRFTDPYINLSRVYFDEHELDSALMILELAIQRDLLEPPVFNGIGSIHFQKGDLNKAIIYFQKAIDLNPNHFDALLNIGKAFEKKGDGVNAGYYYERAQVIYDNKTK